MKWRVTLRVESLDGRVLPGGSFGAFGLGDPGSGDLGSKPGGVGDGIQGYGSKPGGTGEGVQGADAAGGIELFGSTTIGSGGII
jgi:hypothetical protein